MWVWVHQVIHETRQDLASASPRTLTTILNHVIPGSYLRMYRHSFNIKFTQLGMDKKLQYIRFNMTKRPSYKRVNLDLAG